MAKLQRAPLVHYLRLHPFLLYPYSCSASLGEPVKRVITVAVQQEPVIPGCFLRAKAIGLMPMIDQVWFLHNR